MRLLHPCAALCFAVMNLLALDTSTEKASIAWGTKSSLQSCFLPFDLPHSQTLLPALKNSNIDLTQLSALAFNQGPGAFTALRQSAATVQAFALTFNLPIFGVSSFESIALPFLKENRPILALIDARMNEIYAALLMPHEKGFAFLKNPFLMKEGDDFSLPNETLAVGNIQALYPRLIETFHARHIPFCASFPTAKEVARCVFLGGGKILAPEEAHPVYVRNKVAQTLLEREGKL